MCSIFLKSSISRNLGTHLQVNFAAIALCLCTYWTDVTSSAFRCSVKFSWVQMYFESACKAKLKVVRRQHLHLMLIYRKFDQSNLLIRTITSSRNSSRTCYNLNKKVICSEFLFVSFSLILSFPRKFSPYFRNSFRRSFQKIYPRNERKLRNKFS